MIRWKRALLVAVSAAALMTSATAANASPAAQQWGNHKHHFSERWLRKVGQFYLGDSTNPLFAALDGTCGQLKHGVFYMAAPIDLDVQLYCRVPVGTPIVVSPAAWFSTEGIDGDTDQELKDAAVAAFKTSTNWLTLDGRNIFLRTIKTGAYDVNSEPGSFYDAILGVGTGPVRTALVGNVVWFGHLSCGRHVVKSAVTFVDDGGDYSATYHIHVVGCWSQRSAA